MVYGLQGEARNLEQLRMRPMVYRRCSPSLLLLSTRAAAAEVLVMLTVCRGVDTAAAAVGVVLMTDMVAAAVLVGEAWDRCM